MNGRCKQERALVGQCSGGFQQIRFHNMEVVSFERANGSWGSCAEREGRWLGQWGKEGPDQLASWANLVQNLKRRF
jgi:hypothetical protein